MIVLIGTGVMNDSMIEILAALEDNLALVLGIHMGIWHPFLASMGTKYTYDVHMYVQVNNHVNKRVVLFCVSQTLEQFLIPKDYLTYELWGDG